MCQKGERKRARKNEKKKEREKVAKKRIKSAVDRNNAIIYAEYHVA